MDRNAQPHRETASLISNVAIPLRDLKTLAESLATLAEPRGMRPLVAHCDLGLGKLYFRTDKREQAQGAPRHRDDDVPRDGDDVLAGEGGGGDENTGRFLTSLGRGLDHPATPPTVRLGPERPEPGCLSRRSSLSNRQEKVPCSSSRAGQFPSKTSRRQSIGSGIREVLLHPKESK